MHARMRSMHHHHGGHRGRGPGGHGFGRQRARRGAVRSTVLRLLGERPMHGYELINEFEERTGGRWKPSPGSIYPTLSLLEDEGLVRSTEVDGRKRFELTDAGRTWLDEHAGDEDTPLWERAGVGGRGDLRRLGGEIFGQLRQLSRFGSPEQLEKARAILTRARTELYAVLAAAPEDDESR